MNVLIVGSGGREHALAWKLSQSKQVDKIYCAPGNGGIAQIAECVDIASTDMEQMTAFAKEHADFVVVAPDDPLAMGMVDALNKKGIRAFGPTKDAAVIEASKIFAKELMKKYSIPTAKYESFEDYEAAKAFADQTGCPIVIKADGLALGKGVVICNTLEEAHTALKEMLVDGRFGSAGKKVLVEEFMTGPEVSVLTFTDGKTVLPMVSAQDHKRVFDGDLGPNTGGMGAFAPTPKYTNEIAAEVEKNIILPTVKAMEKEGRPFKGVLYFGLMLTKDGPKVLEYNARFGDPETQAVLMLLNNDLLDVMEAVVDERLHEVKLSFKPQAAVCVVMASAGYPGVYEKGKRIEGLGDEQPDTVVFHAGTKRIGQVTVTAGGRVLGVTALGASMDEAREKAYSRVETIRFEGAQYRRDIGVK
ncbi:MAG: phosphoribosylamine--glycine ligase [Christensenellales bacterium]